MTATIMETHEDGRTFGWLGLPCPRCKGYGEDDTDGGRRACRGCGGTGEAYGEIKPDTSITPPDIAIKED